MTATPHSMVQTLLEDASLALISRASIDGVTLYTSASASLGKLAENRVEVIAGDVEPEFPDAPTNSQAAGNLIVQLVLRIVTSAKPTYIGEVETEGARGKHTLIRGQVLDAIMRDDLAAALIAEVSGLHVGLISWEAQSAVSVENGSVTSEIVFNAHACAK